MRTLCPLAEKYSTPPSAGSDSDRHAARPVIELRPNLSDKIQFRFCAATRVHFVTDIFTLDGGTAEQYVEIVTGVARALEMNDISGAEQLFEPVVDDVWQGRLMLHGTRDSGARQNAARTVSERTRAHVLRRDGFRCTYCGGSTVPRCVLVALSDVFPRFSYDLHYRRGRIHPAFWSLAPEVDHILPHSRGGHGGTANLTTLHTLCNARKSDSFADEIPSAQAIAATAAWDGLVPAYPAVVEAGNNHGWRHASPSYHARWLRNFDLRPLGPIGGAMPNDGGGPRQTEPYRDRLTGDNRDTD
jgi:hypothetical protein